ncbi:MAG TPA: LytTR family DNA-binding domain-containing protein [Bacteroidia bacterium]
MPKAIIIDDEEMARTLLSSMVEEYCPDIEIIDMCGDLPTGVKSIRKNKPDLVFLDIEMPGYSGLELLEFFNEEEIDFSIIFVTAYHQYAIQAFKLSAIDYLLKPIDVEDLVKAVSLFEKRNSSKKYKLLKDNLSNQPKKIVLGTNASTLFVPLDEILYFKAEGSYTNVFFKDGKNLLTSKNLKYYEDLVGIYSNFYRCHKSYLININFVTEYVKSEGGYLKIGTHQVSVAPDKLSVVLERIS